MNAPDTGTLVEYAPGNSERGRGLAHHLRVLVRSRGVFGAFVYRELKSRYKQSVLGALWIIVNPIIQLLVYTLVFSVFMKVRTGGSPYPVFAYATILPWLFFSQSLNVGTTSLVDHAFLIHRVYFPREVLPMAGFAARFLDLVLGHVVLVPFLWGYHIVPGVWALAAIPILGMILALGLGLSFFFSTLYVFRRDLKHIVTLGLSFGLYVAPVLYPLSVVPERFRTLFLLNPLAVLMHEYRICFLEDRPPEFPALLLLASAVSLTTLIAGYAFLKRYEHRFAEEI